MPWSHSWAGWAVCSWCANAVVYWNFFQGWSDACDLCPHRDEGWPPGPRSAGLVEAVLLQRSKRTILEESMSGNLSSLSCGPRRTRCAALWGCWARGWMGGYYSPIHSLEQYTSDFGRAALECGGPDQILQHRLVAQCASWSCQALHSIGLCCNSGIGPGFPSSWQCGNQVSLDLQYLQGLLPFNEGDPACFRNQPGHIELPC